MTQDTQAGAGAQPAPAIQPEALRIAMYLRQRAQLSRPGNLDTLSASGASELERQHAELSAAQSEAKHWRTNHDNVVSRLRIFTQRPDIPKELADRLPWYRELVRLQAVEAQALQQSAEITDAEIDRIAESMPGGLDGFLKAWGWRQFARAIMQAAPPAPAAVAVPEALRELIEAIEFAPLGVRAIQAMARARAALAAAPAQAVAVPEGWKLVPINDTPAMWTAGGRAIKSCGGHERDAASLAYKAMVEAAPPAQEHATQLAGQHLPADEFRSDTDSLVRNIVALLDLDAQGCLVPHGVGGHARGLLSAAASRLAASDQAQGCTRSHPASAHSTLSKIGEVVACAGRDWPDVPGEVEILRRVKWLARQCAAASANDREAARALPARGVDPMLDTPAGLEPVATIASIDEHGPCFGWHQHWANFPVGTKLYTAAQVQAMGRVTPGWQAVPVAPSSEMVQAGVEDLRLRGYKHALIVGAVEVWRAMLAAAPRPPAAQELKPLTPEQIHKWWASENGLEDCDMGKLIEFTTVVREFESKLGIK